MPNHDTQLNFIDLLQITKKPWKSLNHLLDTLKNNSPFLKEIIEKNEFFIIDFIHENPYKFWIYFIESIKKSDQKEKNTFLQYIRLLKQRALLFISICDIGHIWSVETTTKALSEFTDTMIDLCLRYLFEECHKTGSITQKHDESGYFIVAMGKWGAFELNYSSDIDFIIFYDPEILNYKGRDYAKNFVIRLSQQLIQLLEPQTEDGFVFRTDLRLRPDPFSFPIAVTTQSAEIYYQSRAETWERSAFIKARIAAGDKKRGQEFLEFLKPFIWRKHLDFASIQDIQNLRYRILSERQSAKNGLDYFNIKLGPGGIREIEFYVQSQQLIWGGRHPILRQAKTLLALEALSIQGYISSKEANILHEAYILFRNLEHKMQLMRNEQTHDLPGSTEEWIALSHLFGVDDLKKFQEKIIHYLQDVERITRKLFTEHAPQKEEAFYIKENENDETTHILLREAGYRSPSKVLNILKMWHHGKYRVLRNERTRKIIEHISHDLLKIFAETPNPDLSIQRFDQFLANLPMGIQLFSLFQAKPKLLKLLTNIIGKSTYLSDLLVQLPDLFDLTMLPSFYDNTPYNTLEEETKTLPDFQSKLEFLQKTTTEKKFQIGVHIIEELTKRPSEHLTNLADIVIKALTNQVKYEFEAQQGTINDLQFAILGFGSLGASEMTHISDLDLVFIYDLPNTKEAKGTTNLLPAHYMARFCKRLITGFTSLGKYGNLYDVDMRLRPSGNSGPIIHTFQSFQDYYRKEAWVWEIMALTKARIIYGQPKLTQKLNTFLNQFLTEKRDTEHIRKALVNMRERIQMEKKPEAQDLMFKKGGIIDLNFLIQYLKLAFGHQKKEIFPQNTLKALEQLKLSEFLDPITADRLINAQKEYLDWRHLKALQLDPLPEISTDVVHAIYQTYILEI